MTLSKKAPTTTEELEAEAVRLEAQLGAPVDPKDWEGLDDEAKGEKVAELMERVDAMNREMLKDNKLGLFLYKLNYAVMRTGGPIPRQVCELAGVDKQTLKRLARKGFLEEYRVRNSKTHSEVVAYVVAANITFQANGDHFTAIEVIPADVTEEVREFAEELALEDEGK